MDSRLEERLIKWHDQLKLLKQVEEKYFLLEASEDSFFSEIYLKAEGKTVSEKEAVTHNNPKWIEFKKGLAAAQSQYNHEKRLLELKIKSYESEYLDLKLSGEYIRRGNS